jgi:CBS domain-containing protein
MEHKQSLVRAWMTQKPLTVRPETSAVEAYERMREQKIHRLPVIDATGQLVGIVTRSDIEGAVAFRHTPEGWHEARFALAGAVVSEMMTAGPLTVTPDAAMSQAIALMLAHHLSGLPVVAEGKLVGIITETDVFRLTVSLLEK